MMKHFVAVASLISCTYAYSASPLPTPTPHTPKTILECIYSIDERSGPDMQGFTASGDFAMNLPKNYSSKSEVQFAPGYVMVLSYQQDNWLVAAIYKRPALLMGYTSIASISPFDLTLQYDGAIPEVSPTGKPYNIVLSCWPELR
ncbi:MAG: hypothetical protein JST16_18940 [Bdellovibrionales bacterium]|nr:hypothetical protein [Bdellovibrionales bacterium]